MVVFTCNHCGETVHKPKVEKHYQFQCRNYKYLTCVDCFKDFRNDEYNVHTKCITEDERYAAKGTYKNGIFKKGDAKQESWLEMIKSICEAEKNLKPSLRQLLQTISEYENVPRKKVKFINFIKSSSGGRANMRDVEEAWDIIEKHKVANFNKPTETNNKRKADEETNDTETVTKKKKESAAEIEENVTTEKFDYKAKILEILAEKQTISQKKLQKKIVRAYMNVSRETEDKAKIIKKLNKKLKKIPNVLIENDKVILNT
ncbi:unnamed protein product [Ceutorhynchus assimilis]|uniref:Cell growth-regulating nucleolar protein n=1 Tax=Ceutorhynchus assimilis TaxID=467358 RepID=A0A9P0GQ96_9CUCU|nr:unnamed protein product [Ceutorhynchus assimilis]